MNISDITIRIHPDLSPLHQERLIEELRIFEGITMARVNPRVNNWIGVAYDADLITPSNILAYVKRWDKKAEFLMNRLQRK